MVTESPLAAAAFYCDPGALRAELKSGANPNLQDSLGRTPLMWLCEMFDSHTRARKRMFRKLLEAGADLEVRDESGLTAWHYAATSSSRSFRRYVRLQYIRKLGRAPNRHFTRDSGAQGAPERVPTPPRITPA